MLGSDQKAAINLNPTVAAESHCTVWKTAAIKYVIQRPCLSSGQIQTQQVGLHNDTKSYHGNHFCKCCNNDIRCNMSIFLLLFLICSSYFLPTSYSTFSIFGNFICVSSAFAALKLYSTTFYWLKIALKNIEIHLSKIIAL